MVDNEGFEDVLTFINKNRDDENQFTSRSAWMRHIVRTYAILSNNNRRRWESNGTLIVDGRVTKKPDLKLWIPTPHVPGTVGDLDDGLSGELVGLSIGDLQYSYLKRAVVWENTFQKEISRTSTIYHNVAILAQNIVLNQLLVLWSQVDEEKMNLEESKLEDDPLHT